MINTSIFCLNDFYGVRDERGLTFDDSNYCLLLVLPVSVISPSCSSFRVDIQIIDLEVTKPETSCQ